MFVQVTAKNVRGVFLRHSVDRSLLCSCIRVANSLR